jgi:hypothetical protein
MVAVVAFHSNLQSVETPRVPLAVLGSDGMSDSVDEDILQVVASPSGSAIGRGIEFSPVLSTLATWRTTGIELIGEPEFPPERSTSVETRNPALDAFTRPPIRQHESKNAVNVPADA